MLQTDFGSTESAINLSCGKTWEKPMVQVNCLLKSSVVEKKLIIIKGRTVKVSDWK